MTQFPRSRHAQFPNVDNVHSVYVLKSVICWRTPHVCDRSTDNNCIQPICRTQSFLKPRFSLVKNKQLQLGHLAGCIYPGEALNKGRYLCFLE